MSNHTREATILLQLSDLHLRAGEDGPDLRLTRAIAAASELRPRPRGVLLSGDIADEPAAEVYERAHRMLSEMDIPVYAIPGNHDDRDLLAKSFAGRESATGEPVNFLANVGALRLVGCDTSVPGMVGGALPTDQLAWLAAALDEDPARSTLLALHHPPVACGIRAMDDIALDEHDAARLESLLESHPQVLAVTCGHVHRTVTTSFAGRPLLICPSTNSALRLDLRPDERQDAIFEEQPLGFAVHSLVDGRLVSHVQPLSSDHGAHFPESHAEA
ncbi:MAG TPA: phosphodiesterase [Solirubrobacteraceae bacterium]|jgi:3',5'-cyclic AMP phosphodiesterase CpdA|nr:phosphodiesterase [Solirubrobacteraceae bacterium]